MIYKLATLTALVGVAQVFAHPCDKEHAEHFETVAAGPELGEKLIGLDRSKKSEECNAWLDLNQKCSADLKALEDPNKPPRPHNCYGMQFQNDSELCVGVWTPSSDLSDDCKNAVTEYNQ